MGFRGQFDEHRRFQIEMLKSHGLERHHMLLEIGCGPLTAGIPIIEYLDSGNYFGIDIRNSVLDLAWKEIGKAGFSNKNPRLICSKSFGEDALGADQFDFVYSFSVLFHLSDEILSSYFATVANRLKPDGICLANVNTHLPNDNWLEFPFLRRTIEEYAIIAQTQRLKTVNLGEIRDLGFRNDTTERRNPLLSFQLIS